jgi:hypothetical protein
MIKGTTHCSTTRFELLQLGPRSFQLPLLLCQTILRIVGEKTIIFLSTFIHTLLTLSQNHDQ